MLLRIILCFIVVAVVSGCTINRASGPTVEHYFWIAAPKHYDIWVEHLRFEKSGEYAWHQAPGYVSCCWRGDRGPKGVGGRLELFPNYIGVQWFSYSEQKYYQRLISVKEEWRIRMAETVPVKTHLHGMVNRPRNRLVLGLAPGGTIVVWMLSRIGNEVELDRLQANEIPGDPAQFRHSTENYLKQHGDYVQKHGIPLDGW